MIDDSRMSRESPGGSTTVLLEAASKGDPGARDRLLSKYEPRLRHWVERCLGPRFFRDEGDDLLQNVRLAFVQALPKVREFSGRAFQALVRRMVQNEVADWHKARGRKRRDPGGPQRQLLSTLICAPRESGPSPSQILVSEEQIARLRDAIELVPERYRPLLGFVLARAPSPRELAAFLEKEPDAARQFLRRALAHLRTVLQSQSRG